MTQDALNPLERIPPYDEPAEKAVLGAMMMEKLAAGVAVEMLVPDDFYLPRHAALFKFFVTLLQKNDELDPVLTRAALEEAGLVERVGGMQNFMALFESVPSVGMIENYCNTLRGLSQRRRLLVAAGQVIQIANRPDTENDIPVAEQAMDVMEKSVMRSDDSAPLDLQDVADPIIKDSLNNPPRAVWGLATKLAGESFDNLTGGIHAGEFWALGAVPGMGKSTLINALARGVRANNPDAGEPLILSTEMAPSAMALFAIGATINAHTRGIIRRDLGNGQRMLAEKMLDERPLAGIKVMYAGGRTIQAVRMIVRTHKRRFGLPLLIVDMASGLYAEARTETERIGKILRGLKDLKVDLNCCLIACAHVNRQVHNDNQTHKPEMRHFRDSGEWEQTVDRVLFLHREAYYGKDDPRTEIIQAKDRNVGIQKSIFVEWHRSTGQYVACEEEPEEEHPDAPPPPAPPDAAPPGTDASIPEEFDFDEPNDLFGG